MRANMPDLIHWQCRLGRQRVNPVETTRLLQQLVFPVEGMGSWDPAFTAAANATLNYSDDCPDEPGG